MSFPQDTATSIERSSRLRAGPSGDDQPVNRRIVERPYPYYMIHVSIVGVNDFTRRSRINPAGNRSNPYGVAA